MPDPRDHSMRSDLTFLDGSGRMGGLIRRFDWSATALGPPETWPTSLRTAVSMILASGFPSALVWGRELVTIYNDAFGPILGEKPEALGRSFSEVWAEAWDAIGPIALRAFGGEATFIEDFPLLVNRRGVLEEAFFTFCYSPVRDDSGAVVGFLDTVVETTDKVLAARALRDTENELRRLNATLEHRIAKRSRRLEEQMAARQQAEAALFRSQKMEAVGQLTGGIAHDFNNLLTVVCGNLELLRERIPGDARLQRMIDPALQAAARGARLTGQLLAFSRRQPLQPQVLRVDRVIDEFSGLVRHVLGATIELEIVHERKLWACELDPAQLESAVLNLAINARDSMPEGGQLEIATRNVTAERSFVTDTGEVVPGRYVEVCVADTGTGMEPEIADRAFEPFFTTKATGKGSGLGLSMVYGFVQQSRGHLQLVTAPGAGTTFRLLFPASTKIPAVATETPSGSAPGEGRDATILLVEDEADVLDFMQDTLLAAGYRVLTAPNGAEALRLLNGPEAIDLLVSDVVMPGGISGLQLAERARQKKPALRVLLISGYPGENATLGAYPFLPKPFGRSNLVGHVRSIIGAPLPQA